METMTESTMKDGSKNEDANEHIETVLEIVDLFTTPDVTYYQLMLRVFPITLTRAASRLLRNEHAGSITTWEILKGNFLRLDVPTIQILDYKGGVPKMSAAYAKKAIQEMADYSRKWHDGTSTISKSSNTSDGLAAIQAQLNNLGRKIKKEEGKTLEEACYTQFRVPFPNAGRYRAVLQDSIEGIMEIHHIKKEEK
ncbi:hypothetical protein Tco_0878774 [Tanacetum coccineum]|uniref:Uncharacterized protein n=1 Tax=Tanacetum coccineum TaxID=301880 RepID=A0ABQ5C213_9ASTR